MKILQISIVFVVATAGCASVNRSSQRIFTPSDIVHNAAALKGRQVHVIGHLALGQDTRALWDSSRDEEDAARGHHGLTDPIWDRCITAYYDFGVAQSVQRASSSYVEVVGTVGDSRGDRRGLDLWSCNDIYITIHAVGNPTSAAINQTRARAADQLPPRSDDGLIPSNPAATTRSPSRPPNDQNEQPQF